MSFFTSVCNHFGRDYQEICFYFKCSYLKEHYSVFKKKKNGDLGTMPYYLSKIASVEKIWTLFNCISWCLTDHMTIWTKFVNDNGGLLEYLLSGMWSFGDLCIFGCKNIRRLLFFVILRLGLLWCHQDHRIFSYFFITLPHLKPKHRNQDKHLWSVGHHKILSPEIQKSYFWQPYFPYWWSKKNFLWKMVFLQQKQHTSKWRKYELVSMKKLPILPDSYR